MMATRSSSSNQSIKPEIIGGDNNNNNNSSSSSGGNHSRQQHDQRDDARDPHHDNSISDNEREDSPSSPIRCSSPSLEVDHQDYDVDAAPPSAADDYYNVDNAKSATAAHEAAQKKIKAATARAKKIKKTKATKAATLKSATANNETAPSLINGYPDMTTMMATSSFDQAMALGPSASFSELPLGNFHSPGLPSHLRHNASEVNNPNLLLPSSSVINNVNNMPMSELDNPSWDLLNQDSFGFNLLGSQGSLSFETGEQAVDHHTGAFKETTIAVGGTSIRSGRERERSVDLTSAVTASLDDTPLPKHTMDWSTAPIIGMGDTTIVNSMNHSWIPPHSPPTHPAYSHHGHPSHYGGHPPPPHNRALHPPPHPMQQQESRSDIPHGYLYSPELRDNHLEDPFKYAFGIPNAPDADGALLHPNDPRQPRSTKATSRAKSNSTSVRNAATSSSSRRNKKRKPAQQEPLDGHQSPPPLKTIESAPTNTLEMMNPPSTLDPSWSASPGASRHFTTGRSRGGRARSRMDKQHAHYSGHPDIGASGRSSTWHGGPAPGPPPGPPIMGGYHPHPRAPHHAARAPPPFPSSAIDPIHSAFLPPMPMRQNNGPPQASSAYNNQPPSSAHPQLSGNPPREVYITTKPSGAGANGKQQPQSAAPNGGYRIPPPQFVNMHPHSQHGHRHPHHPPPYNYPQPVRSGSNIGAGGHSKAQSSAPGSHLQPVNATVGLSQQQLEAQQQQQLQQHPQQHPPPPPPEYPTYPQPPRARGKDLLTLRTGTTLTRLQAPGIGWPPEEDARLTEVMSNHRSSQVDWASLCMEHGLGRTARECHDRWTRYLKPGSRKGQWREEEDAIVLRVIFGSGKSHVGSHVGKDGTADPSAGHASPFVPAPFTQWADLAPQLPGRTGKQIRDRWVNYLNPAINHLPFSHQDDLNLWAGHTELGKRWVEISAKIFHNTRSENHIKNRWYSAAFKKFIAKEFGMDAYVDAKQSQGGVGVNTTVANALLNSGHHQGQQQQGRSGVQHPQQHMHHHNKQAVHQVGGRMHRNGVLSLNSSNHQVV